MNCAVTLRGIRSALAGSMASSSSAPSPVGVMVRISPTCMPRTFTSPSTASWLPTLSVSSLTLTTGVNTLLYKEIDRVMSPAISTMNPTPSRRRRTTAPLLTTSPRRLGDVAQTQCPTIRSQARSSRDPHRDRGAPDGEADEEVQQRGSDDRGAHRAAHRDAHAGRPAAGPVAVVAVHQDDRHGEDQHLAERPEHVLRR